MLEESDVGGTTARHDGTRRARRLSQESERVVRADRSRAGQGADNGDGASPPSHRAAEGPSGRPRLGAAESSGVGTLAIERQGPDVGVRVEPESAAGVLTPTTTSSEHTE